MAITNNKLNKRKCQSGLSCRSRQVVLGNQETDRES